MNTLSLIATLASLTSGSGTLVSMQPITSGAITSCGRTWMTAEIVLSSVPPATLRKVPTLTNLRYGKISLGSGKQQRVYDLILDDPAGKTTNNAFGNPVQSNRLCIDINRNGDFTDDPELKSKIETINDFPKNGNDFSWLPLVDVVLAGKSVAGSIGIQYYVPDHPWKAQAGKLFWYNDFGVQGRMTIGEKSYNVVMRDLGPETTFANYKGKSALLCIDRDGDGQITPAYEQFSVDQPFCLDGVTYEIADLEPSGASFRVVRSMKTVAEKPVPVLTAQVGMKAPAFSAPTVVGKTIEFPSSIHGKLILLDFWATWCGPCMAESPNVIAAEKKYARDGLVVVGVSLDKPGQTDIVSKVAAEKGLTWQHVYDGLEWNSPIVKAYRVTSIPTAFLIDGDTGKILATGRDLRGEALEKTIAAAIAKRNI